MYAEQTDGQSLIYQDLKNTNIVLSHSTIFLSSPTTYAIITQIIVCKIPKKAC